MGGNLTDQVYIAESPKDLFCLAKEYEDFILRERLLIFQKGNGRRKKENLEEKKY